MKGTITSLTSRTLTLTLLGRFISEFCSLFQGDLCATHVAVITGSVEYISVFPWTPALTFFCSNVKKKSAKKKGEEASDSDLESDDDDGLDDEEVSLGSMDEEDFGDELEEEGGAFMNMGGDDEDDDDDDAGR